MSTTQKTSTPKKPGKISVRVIRDANNRILTADSPHRSGNLYIHGPNGTIIDLVKITDASGKILDPDKIAEHVKSGRLVGATYKGGIIDVFGPAVRRGYADFVLGRKAPDRTGTVISKDSVQRAAKSAMSQFRSKK